MFNFSKLFSLSKKKKGIGISISRSSICMAELFKNESIFLSQTGEIELIPGCFGENGEIIKPDEIYRALLELTEITGIQNRQVVTAVHGNMVFIRQFFLPLMSEKELASAVVWEAESWIPFDLNDVEMDYAVTNIDEENAQVNVLVAAVSKSLSWQYYDLFTSCGLELTAIEVEPVAIARLPIMLGEKHDFTFPTALVDLGDHYTNLVVVSKNEVHLMRTIPMEFEVNNKEDNIVKLSVDAEYEDKLKEVAFEIERSLKYLQSRSSVFSVNQVLISGIGADADAEKVLNGIIDLPVETLRLGLQEFDGDYFLIPPKFGIAAGLALREVE
ncbi:MAG: Type IV pilus assembly protein PilM [Clostridia bacterium 41_269]|nr:MAG: Type IV pilus assembly protein PilM [Clostridia bacterium 41_269]